MLLDPCRQVGIIWYLFQRRTNGFKLDSRLVLTASDAHEATLSPIRSPGVLHDPVLLAILFTPPDKEHSVINLDPVRLGIDARVAVHTLLVVHEVIRRADRDSHGAVLMNFLHHSCCAATTVVPPDVAKVLNLDGRVAHTTAEIFLMPRQQRCTAQVVVGEVLPGAVRGQQAHLVGPQPDQERVPTFAALIEVRAVQRKIDRERRQRSVLLHDAVPHREHIRG
mmetsp:Transcript_21469/g.52167  ORF Transcript_21469/g.52167 Transcript_21469/m.52167 type:complete len:223 (-) Transcript_21469:1012-1680(-)